MPIIKSAKKRVRQASAATLRNVATKRDMRAKVKAVVNAVEANDKKAPELLKEAQSAIDTAVKKNIIHKNKAARMKSQLNAKVKSLGGKLSTGTKKAAPKKPATKKAPAKKTTAKKAPAKKPAAKKTATKKPATKKTATKK